MTRTLLSHLAALIIFFPASPALPVMAQTPAASPVDLRLTNRSRQH